MGSKKVELFAAIRFDWQRNQMSVRSLARKYDVHRRTVRQHPARAARTRTSQQQSRRQLLIWVGPNQSATTPPRMPPGGARSKYSGGSTSG